VVGEQPAVDVEDLVGEPVDLSVAQREQQRPIPGLCCGEVFDESFDRPAELCEFPLPGGKQFVDAGVTLHRPGRPCRDARAR
jgi:hypothetical protein